MQTYERRRYKRFPIELCITASKLFKQDYISMEGVNADISIFDISRAGIGFLCGKELPLDYYFDAKITFEENDYFYCVIKIIRPGRTNEEGKFLYGAEFVGLAPFLADRIDKYGKTLEQKHK